MQLMVKAPTAHKSTSKENGTDTRLTGTKCRAARTDFYVGC